MELNRIYNEDCLETMSRMPDNFVDLVLTDPPYGLNYQSNHRIVKHKLIENDFDLFFPIDELWRILKDDGVIFAFYSHKIPIDDRRKKNTIIWVKNNWSADDLKGDYGNQYECIAFMPKDNFKLSGKRYPNVWNFDRVEPKYHPTEKPIDLLQFIIKEKDGIVYDPFMGSGTTAVACEMENRQWLGSEINPEYCDIANKRIKAERDQYKLNLTNKL